MKRTAGFLSATLRGGARCASDRAQVCPMGSGLPLGGRRPRAADDPDTSKGRPIGAHPGVDSWGNKVCKTF